MIKDVPQDAYTAYVSTDYASERIDEPTAAQPTAEPTQDEPQTDDSTTAEPQTTDSTHDFVPLDAVHYADGCKFTNVTDVKPPKDANKKHEYKPIQDDGTAYARVLYTFIYYMRAVRSNKSRWTHFTINTPCFVNALYALSNMVVASVLKKIYDASANPTILKYRALDDVHALYCTQYAAEHATATRYTKSGTQYTEIINSDLNQYEKDALKEGLSERMNMVQDTAEYILEYCAKLSDKEIITNYAFNGIDVTDDNADIVNIDKFGGDGKTYSVNFMTRPRIVKRPNKRVYFTDLLNDDTEKSGAQSVRMVKECTTFLQMIHRHVREYIDDNDSKIALSRKYHYIDMEITDAEGNTIECYERSLSYVEKTFDGGVLINADGKKVIAHGDDAIIDDYIQRMDLTEPQREILKYRLMDGGAYGYKAIGTATGRTASTVKSIMRGVRVKAVKIGLTTDDSATDNIQDDNTAIQGAHRDNIHGDDVQRATYAIDNVFSMAYRQPTDSRTAWTPYSTVNTYTAKYRQSYTGRAVLVGTAVQHRHFDDDAAKVPYIRATVRAKYDMTIHDAHAPNIAFDVDADFKPIDITLDGARKTTQYATIGTRIIDGVRYVNGRAERTADYNSYCNSASVYSTSNNAALMSFLKYIHGDDEPQPTQKKSTATAPQGAPLDDSYTKYTAVQDDRRQTAVQTAVQPYTVTQDAHGVNHIEYSVYDMRAAAIAYMHMTQTQRADIAAKIKIMTAQRPKANTAK